MSDSFTYQVTPDDLIAFNLHVARNSEAWQAGIRRGQLSAALTAAAVIIVFNRLATGSWLAGVVVGAIVATVTLAAYPAIARDRGEKFVVRQVRKLCAQNQAPGTLGAHQMTLSEEGFVESTPLFEVRYQWAAADHVDVIESHVFIFVAAGRALLVPFASGSVERERILDILRRHLPPGAIHETRRSVTGNG